MGLSRLKVLDVLVSRFGVEIWRRDSAVNKKRQENRHPHHLSVFGSEFARQNQAQGLPVGYLTTLGMYSRSISWVRPANPDERVVYWCRFTCLLYTTNLRSFLLILVRRLCDTVSVVDSKEQSRNTALTSRFTRLIELVPRREWLFYPYWGISPTTFPRVLLSALHHPKTGVLEAANGNATLTASPHMRHNSGSGRQLYSGMKSC